LDVDIHLFPELMTRTFHHARPPPKMPLYFFWAALKTTGDADARAASSRVFDVHATALAYVRATGGCVLLGGRTLLEVVSKCHGRLPDGALVCTDIALPKNKGAPESVAVPSRGPVTIEEKRAVRAERKVAAAAHIAAAAKTAAAVARSDADGGDEGVVVAAAGEEGVGGAAPAKRESKKKRDRKRARAEEEGDVAETAVLDVEAGVEEAAVGDGEAVKEEEEAAAKARRKAARKEARRAAQRDGDTED
jgi:hypothetical protein